jgi:NTE family protein
VHLNNASIFNRHDFPEQTIIEIRPQKLINSSNMLIMGELDSIFDFSAKRIRELKHQGYQDAKKYLEDISKAICIRWEQKIVQKSLLTMTQKLLDDSPC